MEGERIGPEALHAALLCWLEAQYLVGVDRRSFRQLDGTIGDDWIINDGSETTIVVHSVTLHDGATGSTGLKAANGAWDVMVIDEGVTVDTSTTQWTISASSRAKRPDALLPPNRREAHDSATPNDRPALTPTRSVSGSPISTSYAN